MSVADAAIFATISLVFLGMTVPLIAKLIAMGNSRASKWIVITRRTPAPPIAPAAAARGWQYTASSGRWAHLFTVPPFGMRGAPYATDVVHGSREGGAFVAFTLHGVKRTNSSSERSSAPWRVVAVPLGGRIPRVSFTPTGALAELLGVEVLEACEHEVLVESHAFNERWRAGTDDTECAHAVLTSTVITALIDAPSEIYSIFIENGYLVAATAYPAHGLDWIDAWLDVLERMRDGVPPFVWERWRLPAS
ncbi:hypothetical protein [Demequina activiva]|uniref:Uncharacterized protein n=1 Tax=Demequina activiva TaxID=1582364 RepID=A0A919Q540_9MICO|nr:hypothetical protein [Demequina activiva]GIG54005.1 hypothetical protein Dac01nite_07570 [Demequina activiva]